MKIQLWLRKVVNGFTEIWRQADLPLREFLALRMQPHIVQVRDAWAELCAVFRRLSGR